MNNIIFQEFIQKIRANSEELVNELSKQPLDPKDALLKIKTLRDNMLHLTNYVKIEEHLQNKNK